MFIDFKSLPLKKRVLAEHFNAFYGRAKSEGPFQFSHEVGHTDESRSLSTPGPFDGHLTNETSRDSLQSDHSNSSDGLKMYLSDSEDQVYQCPDCHRMFYSLGALRIHVRRHVNKQIGRYRCDICGQTFSQRSGQVSHIRVHTRERPYSCEHCPKSFADFSTFTKHRRIHTGEKPYVCSICSKSFTQSGNMHRHVRVVHMASNRRGFGSNPN